MAPCGRKSCVVCRKDKSSHKHLIFHRFPKDTRRCLEWLKNLNIAYLKEKSLKQLHTSQVVCSDHFLEDHYVNGRLLPFASPVVDAPDSTPEVPMGDHGKVFEAIADFPVARPLADVVYTGNCHGCVWGHTLALNRMLYCNSIILKLSGLEDAPDRTPRVPMGDHDYCLPQVSHHNLRSADPGVQLQEDNISDEPDKYLIKNPEYDAYTSRFGILNDSAMDTLRSLPELRPTDSSEINNNENEDILSPAVDAAASEGVGELFYDIEDASRACALPLEAGSSLYTNAEVAIEDVHTVSEGAGSFIIEDENAPGIGEEATREKIIADKISDTKSAKKKKTARTKTSKLLHKHRSTKWRHKRQLQSLSSRHIPGTLSPNEVVKYAERFVRTYSIKLDREPTDMTSTATQTDMTGSRLDRMMQELQEIRAKNMQLKENNSEGIDVPTMRKIPKTSAPSVSSEFAWTGRHASESELRSKAVCIQENTSEGIEMEPKIKTELLNVEDCLQNSGTFEEVFVKAEPEFLHDENEFLQNTSLHVEKARTSSDGEGVSLAEDEAERNERNNRIIDIDNLINFVEIFNCPQCCSVGGLDFKGERVCPSLRLVLWEFRCKRGHRVVLEDSQCVIVPNIGQSYSKIQLLKASTALSHDDYTKAQKIFNGLDLQYLEKNEELLEDIHCVKHFEKKGAFEFPKDPTTSAITKRKPKTRSPSRNEAEETPHISNFISDEVLMKVEKEEENKMINSVLKRLLACKTPPPLPAEEPRKEGTKKLKKVEAIADFMCEEFGVKIHVSDSRTCQKRLESTRKRPLRLRKRVIK